MRCKNYEPKDSTTNLQARYNSLQARYDSLKMIHETLYDEYLRKGGQLEESFTTIQRLQDELNHIKRTTHSPVYEASLRAENNNLLKELNRLKEVRELNLRAYDVLLTTHQRTLKELKDYQARWTTWIQPEPTITTYLGKPLEYWTELQERFNERTAKYIKLLDKHIETLKHNIDLQERIDKANDQLCAFRNLFADGV